MRKVVLALAALATFGVVLPFAAPAKADKVVVVNHHHHHWGHHHHGKTVIIKKHD